MGVNANYALSCNDKFMLIKIGPKIVIVDTDKKEAISSFEVECECKAPALGVNTTNLISWHPTNSWVAISTLTSQLSNMRVISYTSDVYVWDFMTGKSIFTLHNINQVTSIAWDKTGKDLLLCMEDQIVKLDFSFHNTKMPEMINKCTLKEALLMQAITKNHSSGLGKFRLDECTTEIFLRLPIELQVMFSPLIQAWNGF